MAVPGSPGEAEAGFGSCGLHASAGLPCEVQHGGGIPTLQIGKWGPRWGGNLVTRVEAGQNLKLDLLALAWVEGWAGGWGGTSLSLSSSQMTVPTSGSGAHCFGTSRMVPCPCHSGSSARRSGADSG